MSTRIRRVRELPSFTLDEAAQAIIEALATIDRSPGRDKVERRMRGSTSARLRALLRLARDPRTPGHYFGRNWEGPALDSWLQHAREIEQGRKDLAA